MLLTFTTFAAADVSKYSMIPADESNTRVWVFNTTNGDIKQCYFQGGVKVVCTKWRQNNDHTIYTEGE